MVSWITPFSRLLLILSAITITQGATDMFTAITTTKPGCQRQCGNLTVPYPFGIGIDNGCSMDHWYDIQCNTSFRPPRAYLSKTGVEILEISATLNALFGTGCDTLAITNTSHCFSECSKQDVIGGTCTSDNGCCKTFIPNGVNEYSFSVLSIYNHTFVSSFSPCSYAFIGEVDRFNFQGITDISDPTFPNRTTDNVPIALEWNVGNATTCIQAQAPPNLSSYACQQNTYCTDADLGSRGYRCGCLPGYEGNPYLSPGCTDTDACGRPINPCVHTNTCKNISGDYECSCPKGQHGDGRTKGTACTPNNSRLVMKIGVGKPIDHHYHVGHLLVQLTRIHSTADLECATDCLIPSCVRSPSVITYKRVAELPSCCCCVVELMEE